MRLFRFIAGVITLALVIPLIVHSAPPRIEADAFSLNQKTASRFADLALGCISREFPNKPGHVMRSRDEVQPPKRLHPAFFGCFDWHSAVHGHWMLVRLLRRFPELPEAGRIRSALEGNLTEPALRAEAAYFREEGRKSFERSYGWAWLLQMAAELHTWDDADGRRWRERIRILETTIVERYLDFLPKQTYPIRTGVHPNTAFGIALALDYARTVENTELETLLVERARTYFLADRNCPVAWEPGGEDFFSPCLMEADLMRRVLSRGEFSLWFSAFLPNLAQNEPAALLNTATVTDRSDGKLVHLDGLNLSRAWCMRGIAASLTSEHPCRPVLLVAARRHAETALTHVTSGDYAGEHWLASFAVFLLTAE
ncbi:MAG TPA: DUF2891 domain-containing protein [Candidatus Aminicenantes bacterium]|nr:DUF2891 domain-containing protein [Candidatus Aminicenantes bacterium]